MILDLSKILTKVPSALLKLESISLELHQATGWVILEGHIVVKSDGDYVDLVTVNIPAALTTEEINALFTTKVASTSRRRVLKK